MTHIPPVDQRITPEQAYALAQLHAEMMMTLENADWPAGSMHDIWVDTRTLSRKERRTRRKAQRERGEHGTIEKTEKVIIREHAILSSFDLFYFTRSGAVYLGTRVGSPSGLTSRGQDKLVTFATLTQIGDIERAMRAIIEHCLALHPEDATT